jgi:hypothetical protein
VCGQGSHLFSVAPLCSYIIIQHRLRREITSITDLTPKNGPSHGSNWVEHLSDNQSNSLSLLLAVSRTSSTRGNQDCLRTDRWQRQRRPEDNRVKSGNTSKIFKMLTIFDSFRSAAPFYQKIFPFALIYQLSRKSPGIPRPMPLRLSLRLCTPVPYPWPQLELRKACFGLH